MRHLPALVAALLVAALAFVYRFNMMGGRLGGFDNDEFATLTRVDLLLDGQQPLRDFADGELRAVWPSLTYEIPAWAQRLFGENLFVHACLTLGALALCAALVFVLARALSRSWVVAALAALFTVASLPNPYNYPKVLVLTVAALLLRWLVIDPRVWPIACLSAWTVAAALFRHDYGLYVAIASVAAILAREVRPWTLPARRLLVYVALGGLLALPSAIWVARYTGIATYVTDVVTASRTEGGTRRLTAWPVVDPAAPLGEDSLVALNYYLFWAVPFGAAIVLASTMVRRRRQGADNAEWPFGLALTAMALAVNYFFLRSNLPARFGDAAVPVAVLAAWLSGGRSAMGLNRVVRLGANLAPLALAVGLAAFVGASDMRRQLEASGLTTSLEATHEQFLRLRQQLRALPPHEWPVKTQEGALAVSRYLADCTGPDDAVLEVAYADEIPYFARRRLAAGQGYFEFGFLSTEADQRLALERLSRQSAPVAVVPFDYQEELVKDYPLIAEHLAKRYMEVGTVDDHEGRRYVRVFVETARTPRSTDPTLGFPCFR